MPFLFGLLAVLFIFDDIGLLFCIMNVNGTACMSKC